MPRKLLHKIVTAWRMPWMEKTWLLLLYPLSGMARAALLRAPFRRVAPYLGEHHGNIRLSPLADERQVRLARRIGRLCELAARYTPWESKCLVQAIMVKTLLNHYRIPYVLHLGVRKTAGRAPTDPGGTGEGMEAHAWVTVGHRVVTGNVGHRAFTVVSTFVGPGVLAPCGDRMPKASATSARIFRRASGVTLLRDIELERDRRIA